MDHDDITPLIDDEEVSNLDNCLPCVQDETLPLPSGMEYHLFVSCQEADANFAKQLIQDLETRFQFRCLYGDRDFLPGKRILTNVVESVAKCMKFLVILTPHYLESGFCKAEMLQACHHFVRNNMDGCMVCLKLVDCEVPQEIADVTYINGYEMSMEDIAQRVLDAFHKNETYRLPSRNTNGMELLYSKVLKSNSNRCIGSRFQFGEILLTRRECNKDGITFFRNIIEEINTFWWMSFLGSLCSKRLMCFLPVAFFFFAMLCNFAEIVNRREYVPKNRGATVFYTIFIFVKVISVGCYLIYKASNSLDRFLRKQIKDKTLCGTNYFVIRKRVLDPSGVLTVRVKYRRLLSLCLYLIKYNTAPCQLFIENQLTELCQTQIPAEKIKEYSDDCILEAIWTHYNESLTVPTKGLPRHSTYNGVDCLCQLAESTTMYRKFITMIQLESHEC